MRELVITRSFDAPPKAVWDAWTEPTLLMRWWGPRGYTTPVCKIDLRQGGTYFSCMKSPEGQEIWCKGEIREISAPSRLVMTDCFADKEGNIVSAAYYGMPEDWPREMLISVSLEDYHGRTRLTLKHSGAGNIDDKNFNDMKLAWNESFDKLEECLANR